MAFVLPAFGAEVSYFDSVTNPKLSWVLVDDCAVPIFKAKSKDTCYVMRRVNEMCHLDLRLDECNAKK